MRINSRELKILNLVSTSKRFYFEEIQIIHNAKDRRDAKLAYNKWTKKGITIANMAVRCVGKNIEELLIFALRK